eukprot:25350-Rhodomonas_salina.2
MRMGVPGPPGSLSPLATRTPPSVAPTYHPMRVPYYDLSCYAVSRTEAGYAATRPQVPRQPRSADPLSPVAPRPRPCAAKSNATTACL